MTEIAITNTESQPRKEEIAGLYESLEENEGFQERMQALRKGYPDLPYDQQCHGDEFRENADLIAKMLAKKTIDSMSSKEGIVVLMPWRAGLIFGPAYKAEGVASYAHISAKRNEETLETMVDYEKYPEINGDTRLVISDPMLATGNTIVDSIDRMIQKGAKVENIVINAIVAAPAGVDKVKKAYPGVQIIVGSMDEKLDSKGYIVPGLGDFGDKYFDGLGKEYVEGLENDGVIEKDAGEKMIARMEKQKA